MTQWQDISTSWLQRVFCFFGRHRLSYIKKFITPSSHHIGCPACGKQWGMNDHVRLVLPWNDVRGFYREFYNYPPQQQEGE